MESCLYHPEHGYYRRARERFGVRGDFYTSAQVHPAFARLLVRRWTQMWQEMGGGEFTVLELGAGRGDIAREAHAWAAERWPEFARALRYIAVEYGDPLPSPFQGCVFSNEFFDAQPTHVVRMRQGRLREMYVNDQLEWIEGDLSSPELAHWVERLGMKLEEGHTIELSLAAADWMRRFGKLLSRGYVLTFDYGYRVAELPRFPTGTLMTYRKHLAAENVFATPGERDITAHVNFDLLMESGRDAGLETQRFCTQGAWLMSLGEGSQFEEASGDWLPLKNLLFGIGETIQVLEQKKGRR